MHKTSSLEDCFTTIYNGIENKYPQTDDNMSEDIRIRCLKVLCQQHNPPLTLYNIREETNLTEDWLKRMRKGKNTSLENCIVFSLHTIDKYNDVLEFLLINGYFLFPYSADIKKRIYLEGIRNIYQHSFTDGHERCRYMNCYLLEKGLYAISND